MLTEKCRRVKSDFEGLGFCKTKKLSEGAGRLVANGTPMLKLGRVLSKGMEQRISVDLGFF